MGSHDFGLSIKFHAQLLVLDQQAAERVRAGGCPVCGGALYAAHYDRKVRGLSDEAAEAGQYDRRLSFCCGGEGCRSRATPPSVRFSLRRVYAAMAVLALSLSGSCRAEVSESSGVVARQGAPSRSTRKRWQWWWRSGLLDNPWFSAMRAQLGSAPAGVSAPDSLLGAFVGSVCEQVVHLGVWMAPLTTCSVPPEQSRKSMAR